MSGAGDEPDGFQLKRTTNSRHPRVYADVPTDDYNEDRHEKPWQRVPSEFILVLLGVYLLLGYLTQLIEDDMPRVIPEADVPADSWDTFSEESALKYLEQIIGDSPRVAGTEYHLQKTEDLYAMLRGIAAQARTPVRTDWQLATGDFWMNFTVPFVSCYQNVSNVIAVLEGESGFRGNETGSSLLVNCHYDSVPYALGASDNALFCAAMVESLKRLSRRSTKFKHNIVFLFNGAEENPLQASHAFLAHPWARGVTAVVNLDSAGMNGKPSVFQVTDGRLLRAYRSSARRPSAQAVGEFLFSSGIIPSDTDFRVFRDYGHIQGIDVAFTKWGQVYHTRNDEPSLLRRGVLQNAGNTVLALLAAAADIDLREKVEATPMVYADYLNLFMVAVTHPTAQWLDAAIAVFALATVGYYVWLAGLRWSTVRELLWSLLGRLHALAAGALLVLLTTMLTVATTVQLRYLRRPWLAVPLYWVPHALAALAAAHAYDKWRTSKSGLNRSIRALQAMAATRLAVGLLLLAMACHRGVSPLRYVLAVPLLIMSVASVISITMVRCLRLQGWQHLLLEVVLSVPSVMFVCMMALRLDAIMLPTMGRSPGDRPDYIVAVINLGLAVYAGITVSGLEMLFSRRRLWLPLGAAGAACAALMFIPFAPYQDGGPATQRHYWFHSEIVSFNADKVPIDRVSGVLVTKHDPYTTERMLGALKGAGVHLNVRTDFQNDCQTKLYCGLPVYRAAGGRNLRGGLFLYTGPPAAFDPAPDVSANRTCTRDECVYHFTITGASHNLVTITPYANASLRSWSLRTRPAASLRRAGRPAHVLMHSVATYSERLLPWSFEVTITAPTVAHNSPLLDVSLHAHKIHHPQAYTTEYRRLLDVAPKYFNVASIMSFRHNYVF